MSLLTIAIPTYNRAPYLERSLQQLYAQREHFKGRLNLQISDNASTDNTPEVVAAYQQNGLDLEYLRHPQNMGAEYNVLHCFFQAKGQFVLVLGDDDLLVDGSVAGILDILETRSDAGVVFLECFPFNEDPGPMEKFARIDFREFRGKKSFLARMTYNLTFLSSNIVNTKVLQGLNTEALLGSNLPQVGPILRAIVDSPYNIYVSSKVLGAQVNNSGGYNIYHVFGEKLPQIVNPILSERNEELRDVIYSSLLTRFFPYWTLQLRNNDSYEKQKSIQEVKSLINFNVYFWLFVYPMFYLPMPLGKLYWIFIRMYSKVREGILKMVYRN